MYKLLFQCKYNTVHLIVILASLTVNSNLLKKWKLPDRASRKFKSIKFHVHAYTLENENEKRK